MSVHPSARFLLTAVLATTAVFSLSACFAGPPTPGESATPSAGDFDSSEPLKPIGEPQAGYTTLTDDQGVLTIQVPSSWTDLVRPFTSDAGGASIAASTDLDAYFDGFGASGVEFAASPVPGPLDESALADFLTGVGSFLGSSCTPEDTQQPYDDGYYTGFSSSWTDCGGVGTYGFAIVTVNPDNTYVVYVRGKIIAEDNRDEILEAIVSSFQASI